MPDPAEAGRALEAASELAAALHRGLAALVLGQEELARGLVAAVLAGGHVLLQGPPGVGKTLAARALAQLLGGAFARVQCVPDLLPADITGSAVYRRETGGFEVRRGPIFADVVVADELNRTSPRTQSALLEAMAEGQVTIDGQSLPLPRPHLVAATQNPLDAEGTYPLPLSELDRFLFLLPVGYPPPAAELALLQASEPVGLEALPAVRPVAALESEEGRGAWRAAVGAVRRGVTVSAAMADYVHRLVSATRAHPDVELGISTRGALQLLQAARAAAVLEGRPYVTPEDVHAVLRPVLPAPPAPHPRGAAGGLRPGCAIGPHLRRGGGAAVNVAAHGSRVPTARLCGLWTAAAAAALGAGAAAPPALGRAVGAALLLAAAVLCAVDLLRCPRAAELRFGRAVAGALRVGRPSSVTVAFRWEPRRGSAARPFWWTDGAPPEVVASAPEGAVRLRPGETLTAAYGIRPQRRGPARWGPARATLGSPLGLWRLRLAIAAPLERVVYPGPGAVGAGPGRRAERGVPAAGEAGLEFDGVRPYLPGEDARRMAWRVTARRDQPVVLRLRPERGRRVLLAVETGRLSSLALGEGPGAPSRLDAFCDAAERVAAAALGAGDAVGLALLGPDGAAVLPPRGGPGALAPVAEGLAHAEAAGLDVDVRAAVAALLRVPADLVLWFGEAPSPDEAAALLRHLPVLRRSRPLAFFAVAPEPLPSVPGERGAFLAQAAAAAARDRGEALRGLARRGVPATDAPAGRLGGSALGAYRTFARREWAS